MNKEARFKENLHKSMQKIFQYAVHSSAFLDSEFQDMPYAKIAELFANEYANEEVQKYILDNLKPLPCVETKEGTELYEAIQVLKEPEYIPSTDKEYTPMVTNGKACFVGYAHDDFQRTVGRYSVFCFYKTYITNTGRFFITREWEYSFHEFEKEPDLILRKKMTTTMAHVDLCLLEDFVCSKFQEFWTE